MLKSILKTLGLYRQSFSRYCWIVNCGHGIQQVGKESFPIKSPISGEEVNIKEWILNRDVAGRLLQLLEYNNYTHLDLNPSPWQVGQFLGNEGISRIDIANSIVSDLEKSKGKQCLYVSIHFNASGSTTWDNARGAEVYYYDNNKAGNTMAHIFYTNLIKDMPDLIGNRATPVRSRNDLYELRRTIMPAVLIECNFALSNKEDLELAMQDSFRQFIANSLYKSIKRIDSIPFLELSKDSTII